MRGVPTASTYRLASARRKGNAIPEKRHTMTIIEDGFEIVDGALDTVRIAAILAEIE
jgi:hypothetical protein